MKTEIEELKKRLEEMSSRYILEIARSQQEISYCSNKLAALEKQEAESHYPNDATPVWYWDGSIDVFLVHEKCDRMQFDMGLLCFSQEEYDKWSKWTQLDVRVKKAIREGDKMFEDSGIIYCITPSCNIECADTRWIGAHLIECNSLKSSEHVIKVIGEEDLKWYFENRIK